MILCEGCHEKTGCLEGHKKLKAGPECHLCGRTARSVECFGPMAREIERLAGAVRRFGRLMLAQLVANAKKGGWRHCKRAWLFRRVLEECGELADQIGSLGPDQHDRVALECADAANFLLMIALNEMDEKAVGESIARRADKALERAGKR